MTELAFHFGAPDKLAYTCRLLRKAVGSGADVVLLAQADAIARIDADLWSLSPTEFLPHGTAAASAAVQERSPLVLVTDVAQAQQRSGVLVNLTDSVPHGFERFTRVIEVVSTDATDRERARSRWRAYTQRGYTITRHDLNVRRTD